MDYKTIQLAFDGGVATLTLNRPEKRNAISFDLIDDLLRALDEVSKSEAIVLIVTGAGKAFCSGLDLDNLKALLGRSPAQNLKDSQTMVQLFRSLYEFPKVTIAAVNGAAIAGGTGLALLCDFTLAVPDAKFGYTEVRIGFVPAIGREAGSRSSADGKNFRVGRRGTHGTDQRNRSGGKSDGTRSRVGRAVDGKQPGVVARDQAVAHQPCPGGTRRPD
jgi:enoyl-CoA hydratase/carnithine racemase